MENPILRIVKNRKGLKRLHQNLATAKQIGADLKGLAIELELKEKSLMASEKKYRTLALLTECVVDNVPGFIWAKDHKHRYLFTNKPLRDLFKVLDRDDMLGKTDEDLIIKAISAGHRVEITRVKHQKIGSHGDSEIFIKRGYCNDRLFVWEVYRAPFVGEAGKILGTVCVARDITHTYTQEEETN